MRASEKAKNSRKKAIVGEGLINTIINKLPVELHFPSYEYCGPGTKLEKRLSRGDPGINELDRACKVHDIAYSKSTKLEDRHTADKILQEKAWGRVINKDSSINERLFSYLVVNVMKAKRKLGMGLRKKQNGKNKPSKDYRIFKTAIEAAKKTIKGNKSKNKQLDAELALNTAKNIFSINKTKKFNKSRIIPIPKKGGVLPLIPIFAGLSALGALGGSAAGIVKTINDVKVAKKQLEENIRHNRATEASIGNGLFLKPYKKGLGLYLKSKNL